jgi:hypothetical protein
MSLKVPGSSISRATPTSPLVTALWYSAQESASFHVAFSSSLMPRLARKRRIDGGHGELPVRSSSPVIACFRGRPFGLPDCPCDHRGVNRRHWILPLCKCPPFFSRSFLSTLRNLRESSTAVGLTRRFLSHYRLALSVKRGICGTDSGDGPP